MLPFEKRDNKVLVKSNSRSEHGISPERRAAKDLLERGIVVVDKPAGPTSHQISAYVQDILHINKAGHSGTLDPAVTGVLVVALAKSTRIVESLLTAGKEYVCLMHMHEDVPEQDLQRAIRNFTGKIMQKPPLKSAVRRRVRPRTIYSLDMIERKGRDVLFRVGCEAGTYIRKLVHDIGQDLGCGAHMAELRRTKVACFNEEESVTLHDLADAFYYFQQGDDEQIRKAILPIETAVRHMKKIWVHDSAVWPLCHGVQLKLPGIAKLHDNIEKDERVAVMSLKDELVLVGRACMPSAEMLAERGLALKTEQVFMPADLYPKI